MRIHSVLLVLASGLFGTAASAQTPIPGFTPAFTENLETHMAGISPGFVGFPSPTGGFSIAQILPLQGTQNLVINNRLNVLPPQGGSNDLYGNGNDVQILFADPLTKFGGFFSRTNIAVNVTTATLQFFQNGLPVGNPVVLNLPPTGGPGTAAYVFAAFDLTALGGFNEVRIIGNGSRRGYVGIDTMTVF